MPKDKVNFVKKLIGYIITFLLGMISISFFFKIESCQEIKMYNVITSQPEKKEDNGVLPDTSTKVSVNNVIAVQEHKFDDKQVKEQLDKNVYDNRLIRLSKNSFVKTENGYLLGLKLKNITDDKLLLAFYDGGDALSLTGDGGGIYYPKKNADLGLNSVSYSWKNFYNHYSTLNPSEETKMTILFILNNKPLKEDKVFEFNAKILHYNNGNAESWGVGIDSIRH